MGRLHRGARQPLQRTWRTVRALVEVRIALDGGLAIYNGEDQLVAQQAFGAARTGYRHPARERQLSTSLGKTTIMLPRARLKDADGAESEWHSRTIRRCQRRTERVDGATALHR